MRIDTATRGAPDTSTASFLREIASLTSPSDESLISAITLDVPLWTCNLDDFHGHNFGLVR